MAEKVFRMTIRAITENYSLFPTLTGMEKTILRAYVDGESQLATSRRLGLHYQEVRRLRFTADEKMCSRLMQLMHEHELLAQQVSVVLPVWVDQLEISGRLEKALRDMEIENLRDLRKWTRAEAIQDIQGLAEYKSGPGKTLNELETLMDEFKITWAT